MSRPPTVHLRVLRGMSKERDQCDNLEMETIKIWIELLDHRQTASFLLNCRLGIMGFVQFMALGSHNPLLDILHFAQNSIQCQLWSTSCQSEFWVKFGVCKNGWACQMLFQGVKCCFKVSNAVSRCQMPSCTIQSNKPHWRFFLLDDAGGQQFWHTLP